MGHRDSKHWLQGYSGIVESSELRDLHKWTAELSELQQFKADASKALVERQKEVEILRQWKVEASKGMEVRSDEKGDVVDKLAGRLRVAEADAAEWKLAPEEAVAKVVAESSLEIDELIKSNVQMNQENETLVKENETYRIKLATAMEEAEKRWKMAVMRSSSSPGQTPTWHRKTIDCPRIWKCAEPSSTSPKAPPKRWWA